MAIHPVLPPPTSTAYVDMEEVLVTLIGDICQKITPPVWPCTVPPQDMTTRLNRGETIIQVRREGGVVTRVTDTGRVDIAVTCGYRTDAWRVMGWLLPQLYEFTGVVPTSDGTPAVVLEVSDATGTRQRPPLTQDSRAVQTLIQVTIRKPRTT